MSTNGPDPDRRFFQEKLDDEPELRARKLERLAEAMQPRPNRCSQALTPRKVYGLTQKQIAPTLGIAEHTIEIQRADGGCRCGRFFSHPGLA